MSADETSMGTCLCDLFENLSTNKVKPHPIVQLAGESPQSWFTGLVQWRRQKRSNVIAYCRMSADEIDETSMRDLFVPFRAHKPAEI
jgi:hypothetical protein